MTPLDEALETARQNSQQANFFYDAFLNSDLFVPVRLMGTESGSWRKLGVQDKFQPLFIPQGDEKLVPVFDTFERLQQWAQGRVFDYLQLRCHLFLRVLAGEIGIALNAGTDFFHGFSPEILEKLRSAMRPVEPA